MRDEDVQNLRSVGKYEDKHLADHIRVFNIGEEISECELYTAIRDAIDYYVAFRGVSVFPESGLSLCRETHIDVLNLLNERYKKRMLSLNIKYGGNGIAYEVKMRQGLIESCGVYLVVSLLSVLLFLSVFQIPDTLWKRNDKSLSDTSVTITNRLSNSESVLLYNAREIRSINRE